MPARTQATGRTEWIIQAKLPARRVEFANTPIGGRSIPVQVKSDDPGGREASLRKLFDYLASVLEIRPVLLESAGAVSVTASPEELERISAHPLVKRIDPNRRHRLGN